MAVDIINVQFVGGEISCLEFSLNQTIEQMESAGQSDMAETYRTMLAKVKEAPREQL
jgi:hypothetical protein